MPSARSEAGVEDPGYLSRQLVTYLGNKRALLGEIGAAVEAVKRRLGKPRLRVLDGFAGSGVVSRFLKAHAELLVSNDLEDYAAAIGRCYLANRGDVPWALLRQTVDRLNREVDDADLPKGFIEELYSPADESAITPEDRVFYTRRNARRLDNYRRLIEAAPAELRDPLLGPLLSAASVHANTAGVFKGFYKDRATRIGRFGGTHADALKRIEGPIRLEPPVSSRFECACQVRQEDINGLIRGVGGLDLAYFDPPYNQHPYGSNYFMLNLLTHYRRPENISRASGIPADWRRSEYNVRSRALDRVADLVGNIDARFVLISFNDDGFVAPEAMRRLLQGLGSVEEIQKPYNTYRGSRNLRGRPLHVVEHLFLVERT